MAYSIKALEVLVRQYQQEMDEKRKEIVYFLEQQEKLEDYRKRILDDVQKEKEALSENPSLSFTFEPYQRRMNEQLATISRSSKDVESQLSRHRERIRDIFSSMKTYETLLEKRKLELLREEKYKETQSMDDMVMQRFKKEHETQGSNNDAV